MGADPCCQGLLRHHQTQTRMTSCSSNTPPPVHSKVKSPSMTQQPLLTKAFIDHCAGQQKIEYYYNFDGMTICEIDTYEFKLISSLDTYFHL